MKVKDLIAELQKFHPEYEVMIDGYEGGIMPIVEIRKEYADTFVNSEWYYGPHELCYEDAETCEEMLKTPVIYIPRIGQ